MILAWGSYKHPVAEVGISMKSESRYNAGDQRLSEHQEWSITGMLIATSLSDMNTKITALEAAYAKPGQDATLFLDDGVTPTFHQMLNSQALGGIRTISTPDYETCQGAEYGGLFRTYKIVIGGDFPVSQPPSLVAYAESLSFSGGGPMFKVLQPINGPPIKQITADFTPFRATQSGRAVGYLTSVIPNPPKWPYAEHTEQRQITANAPKRLGVSGPAVYTEFEVTWSYQFEDPFPLIGAPTPWV